MKEIAITKVDFRLEEGLDKLSQLLDVVPTHAIDVVNWPSFPYKPDVKFSMAWDPEHFYLKFYVTEDSPSAVTGFYNGPVWEDSCCEFFCAFDNTGYYNLETNCVGMQLLGWHETNGSKEKAGNTIMKRLLSRSTLGNKVPLVLRGQVSWQLLLVVPVSVFFHHQGLKLTEEIKITANFYKCGDKTRTPHFLSWNPIQWAEPSFHQPAFFGKVKLL